MTSLDIVVPKVDQPSYTFQVDPSLAKPKIEQGVIRGATIIQGQEHQFALGSQPINKPKDGEAFTNNFSLVLPGISDTGKIVVCKFNRIQQPYDKTLQISPESRLLKLSNLAGVTGVAELIDVGTISYEPVLEIFDTGQPMDTRSCMFVESATENTYQKPFDKMLVFEAVDYTRAEMGVISDLHQKTGITYRDTDDIVGTNPDWVGQPEVKLYDLGSETCDGAPFDDATMKHVARLIDFAYSSASNRQMTNEDCLKLLSEVRDKVYATSKMMADTGLLDQETYDALKFVLDESNFRQVSGIQTLFNKLKTVTRGKNRANEFNDKYNDALQVIAKKHIAKNRSYAQIMGYDFLYTRRIIPILDKRGVPRLQRDSIVPLPDNEIEALIDSKYQGQKAEEAAVLKSVYKLECKARQIETTSLDDDERRSIQKYFIRIAQETQTPSEFLNYHLNQTLDTITIYDEYYKKNTN